VPFRPISRADAHGLIAVSYRRPAGAPMSFREPKAISIEARAGPEESLTMKIRPLHDRLVVTRVAEETKTSGGLFIPDSAKEKPARGVVVSVGQGKRDDAGKRIALDVKAGDEVLFGKYAGTELKLDGEEHIVLREDEILAIIEK
jgi:chaperonin GroES